MPDMMMIEAVSRKKLLMRLAVAALLAAATFIGFLWLTAPAHRITKASFETIKRGMTRAEVEAILKSKPGNYCTGPAAVEIPRADGSMGEIGLVDLLNDLGQEGDRPSVWIGDRWLILIRFDAKDEAVEMFCERVYQRGWLGTARRWLRID